ncbi:MAG: hypothetical protein Q8942_00470 [Bacillota bacterium]|nr:hypothetical protein [Bacillota bacterium]
MSIFRNRKYDLNNEYRYLPINSVNGIVFRIQNGDEHLRDNLINRYRQLIVKSVSKVVGNSFVSEDSEEFIVGLKAFNEAIDKFDEKKYYVFYSFAQQVISKRISDYVNLNSEYSKIMTFTSIEEAASDFDKIFLKGNSNEKIEEPDFKEDIEYFAHELKKFGIYIDDLVEATPKHEVERQSYIRIAKLLSENDDLYEKLNKNLSLPYKDIDELTGVSKRNLKKNQKFIIEVTIVFKFRLKIFKPFITNIEKEHIFF